MKRECPYKTGPESSLASAEVSRSTELFGKSKRRRTAGIFQQRRSFKVCRLILTFLSFISFISFLLWAAATAD